MARRTDRKQEILNSFTRLVADRGYDEASFADVAAELGVSKGTIVHHFGSKLEMLRTMHAQYMDHRMAEISEIVERIERPGDQVSAIVYALLLCHRDDRDASLAFTREIVRFAREPEMADVRRVRHEYTQVIADAIRRGVERGDFHDGDADLVALQLLGMCNWAWTWYRPESRTSIEQIAATFARTLLAGLSNTRFHDVLADPNGSVPTLVRRIVSDARRDENGGDPAFTAVGPDSPPTAS